MDAFSWPSNDSKKILSRIYRVDGHPSRALCNEKPDILSSTCPQWAAQGPRWSAHSPRWVIHSPRWATHCGQPTVHGGQPLVDSPLPMVGGTLWAFSPGPGRPSKRISNGHPILACAPCDELYFTKAEMSTHVVKHKSSNILLYVLQLSLLASPSCK